METGCTDYTEHELRVAFRLSGLWRYRWTFAKAVQTDSVYIGLRATVRAIRNRQQQYGKPAPIQQALI